MPDKENGSKDLAKDMLVAMYQEEGTQARHHEEQRATVTNLSLSLAAILMAVIGALVGEHGGITYSILPLSVFLLIIASYGEKWTYKLFERSMQCYNRANAYKDLLDFLLTHEDMEDLFPKNKRDQLQKIRDYKDAAEGRKKALERKDGTGPLVPVVNFVAYTQLNPMKPEVYVTPLENAKHKMGDNKLLAEPDYDLYKLWAELYKYVRLFGILLSLLALPSLVTAVIKTASSYLVK